MVAGAAQLAGAAAAQVIAAAAAEGGAAAAIDAICDLYCAALERSDFVAGCPVGAVAAEAHDDPVLRASAAAVFASWRDLLVQLLESERDPAPEASAELLISAVEGALLLCRVERSVEPLRRVNAALVSALARQRDG
jgi:TetR/AcrR family transcriptional repressor of lmrAB and yxaGH operons